MSLQATALELRAEELQLNGDMRSGLLYEVANRREENRRLGAELAAARDRIGALEFEGREAALRLEAADAAAAAASEQAARLSGQLEEQRDSAAALHAVSERARTADNCLWPRPEPRAAASPRMPSKGCVRRDDDSCCVCTATPELLGAVPAAAAQ
jgi:small-conductance mechanosensitive channel